MTSEIMFPDEAEYLGTKVDILFIRGKSVIDGKETILYRIESIIPVFGKRKDQHAQDKEGIARSLAFTGEAREAGGCEPDEHEQDCQR